MSNKYAVRTVRFASGERFPMLVERASGIPLFDPTIFALTDVRAAELAEKTIEQALRSIQVFQLFVDSHRIDLDTRLQAGRVLDLGEIDALARHCRLPLQALSEAAHIFSSIHGTRAATNVVSLEKARMAPQKPLPEIDPRSVGIRLRYIRNYLDWLTSNRLLKLNHDDPAYQALKSSAALVVSAINARIPSEKGRNVHGKREGLPEDARQHLLEVIHPDSPRNPWVSSHARVRNGLAVQWLIQLGVRRGELLGVRISDIDFRKNEVFIARRADDPEDPRKEQPNGKTRDRILALDEYLAKETRSYIIGARRSIKGARRHDFLFVANGNGAPLALSSLNKAIVSLRKKCPELPSELTPHVLRHTWNDRFSELMDESNTTVEQEEKLRSYLAGWSETSGTAADYTRRHVRQKGKEASLALQKRLLKGEEGGK